MDFTNLFIGGAALGFLTSCWGYIKSIYWKICQVFIQRVEVTNKDCFEALIAYLIKNYKRSPLYDKTYGVNYSHIKPTKRWGYVAFEKFGNRSMIFWNGIFPFFFYSQEKKENNGSSSNSPFNYAGGGSETSGILTFFRGTLNVDELICTAVNEYNDVAWQLNDNNKNLQKRFFIKFIPDVQKNATATSSAGAEEWWYKRHHYRLLNYKPEDVGQGKPEGKSSLETLIFPNNIKDLIEEIKLWRTNKQWYQDKGIPWKRGWLLYGVPGTGKTALARAFAEDLDLPIFVFNLAEVFNHELIRSWIEMQQYAPCIALIEDIDNVFHGRTNVTLGRRSLMSFMGPLKEKSNKPDGSKDDEEADRGGGNLNFDVLLNCLDGISRADGIFTIITTNDISKIDPALGQPRKTHDGQVEFISTRPGRIDKAIELTYMELSDKKLMAKRILGEYQEALEQMIAFVDDYPELQETPAQFQERCSQIALKCFWEEIKIKERELYEVIRGEQVIKVDEEANGTYVDNCTKENIG
jgi:hypothetical protein